MLYVNNELVKNVVQGLTIKETLEDTLDHATVIYHSDSVEGFEMYSPAYLELSPKVKAVRLNVIQHQHLDLIDMVLMDPENKPSTVFKSPIIDTVNKKITFGEIKTTWYAYTGSELNIPHGHPIGLIVGDTYPNEQQYLILESFSDYFYMGDNYHKGPGWWQCNAFKYNVEIKFSQVEFDNVVYETNDSFKIHYLVAEDNSTVLGRIPKITYAHTLTLIEPTKYLERITVSAQAYTNRNDLLVNQIEKALVNAEVLRVGEEPRFKLSNELQEFLGDTPGEDFPFPTPTTLRDLLDEMLSVKNARVRIKQLTDFENIVLDYDDLSSVGKEIEEFGNLINRSMSQDLEYLVGNLEVYAQNVEHSEEQSVWHPSAGGWDTFKTNEAELTTSNAFLDTRYPIDYITGFYASVKVDWKYTWSVGGNAYEENGTTPIILDLTKRVFDSESYAALNQDGAISKSNSISYVRGDTIMANQQSKKIFWSVNNFEKALINAFDSVKDNLDKKNEWITAIYGFHHGLNPRDFTFSRVVSSFKYDNALVRIKYVPFIDTRIQVSKKSTPPSIRDLSIYDNQSDKTIELNRFMRQLKDKVQKIGNKTMQIDTTSQDINSIYNLGTKFGKYAIVSREYSKYDKYLKVRYTLNEDFKTINERLNIAREKRIYDIPLKFIERNLLIKESLLISSSRLTIEFRPKLAFPWLIDRIVKTVYGRKDFYEQDYEGPIVTRERITAFLVETAKDTSLGKFKIPINLFIVDDTLVVSAKFFDNYDAGYSLAPKKIKGSKVLHNPYVDDLGEFSTIKMELIKEVADNRVFFMSPGGDIEEAKNLPATSKYFSNGDNSSFRVYKDSDEQISITYQLTANVYSLDEGRIVIGKQLMAENHNITSFQREEDLVVYLSKEKYKANETARAKGEMSIDSKIITSSQSETEYHDTLYLDLKYFGPGNISDFKSWAVGDIEGNLYLAVNDISLRSVYFIASDKTY